MNKAKLTEHLEAFGIEHDPTDTNKVLDKTLKTGLIEQLKEREGYDPDDNCKVDELIGFMNESNEPTDMQEEADEGEPFLPEEEPPTVVDAPQLQPEAEPTKESNKQGLINQLNTFKKSHPNCVGKFSTTWNFDELDAELQSTQRKVKELNAKYSIEAELSKTAKATGLELVTPEMIRTDLIALSEKMENYNSLVARSEHNSSTGRIARGAKELNKMARRIN